MAEADGDDFQMPDPAERGASWRDQSLEDAVRGITDGTWTRPTPSICRIDGTERGLFYPGKVNDIHGVPGVGKSLLLAYAEVQEIAAGHHVVHVDLEDDEYTLAQRLLDLGARGEDIVKYVHYKQPTEDSRSGITYLHDTITEYQPTLVVIDSTGESMAMDHVKANEDDEVARWMRRVARAAAGLGPAVVLLDHVPKAAADSLMPIGSQRKSAGLNGAIYSMQSDKPMSRTQSGQVRIVNGKARGGDNPMGSTVAVFHFDAEEGTFTLRAPSKDMLATQDKAPSKGLQVKVFNWVQANGPVSKNKVCEGVGGNKRTILSAIDSLIVEGYIATAKGPRGAVECTAVKSIVVVD